MWIFCCGMPRSASTLQFQLTAHLVEDAGLGKRLEWVETPQFYKIYSEYSDCPGWKVFKTHNWSEEIDSLFKQEQAKGVYIFRDIRDVIVSKIRKGEGSFNQLLGTGFLDSCLYDFYKWVGLANMLVSKYEDMLLDVPGEVNRIASHLDIIIDGKGCEEIASAYKVEKQLERIDKFLQRINAEKEKVSAPIYDPETLLHYNHIYSGESGQWMEMLSRRQIDMIEKKAGDWLLQNGYKLSSEFHETSIKKKMWRLRDLKDSIKKRLSMIKS